MNFFNTIWGHGKDLDTLQMSCRAIVICLIAIVLIRLSGRRSFGMKSAFDNVIVILLGAILSRPVVGASPFVPSVIACFIIVVIHRFIAWISINNDKIGRLIKGNKILLYERGGIIVKNLKKGLVSEKDIMEELRLKGNTESLNKIEKAYMERNGEISIIKKE
ncbi:MAG TPA: YetF domain-containing protein [Flavipsychrobacter sp.]|nr:YetF domain-containing protein [Flavipsychrobacter sp.]